MSDWRRFVFRHHDAQRLIEIKNACEPLSIGPDGLTAVVVGSTRVFLTGGKRSRAPCFRQTGQDTEEDVPPPASWYTVPKA